MPAVAAELAMASQMRSAVLLLLLAEHASAFTIATTAGKLRYSLQARLRGSPSLIIPVSARMQGIAALGASASRLSTPIMMARWAEEDMRMPDAELPEEVASSLDPSVPIEPTKKMWAAMLRVYPSEEEAIAAFNRNPGVILPYLNCPTNIVGSREVLVSFYEEEGALEVMRQNPGILACSPAMLATAKPEDVRRAAVAIDFWNGLPMPLKYAIPLTTFAAFCALIAKRIIDCQGQICG